MKIKKNEIMFLIAFLGVLVAVVVYMWVYTPTLEKTEALEAENKQHATRIAELEEWESQVDFFREETGRMLVDVNNTFARFPSEYRSEDAVMYAVELESRDPNIYISSIGLTQPQLAYEATPTTIKLNDTMEDGERTYRLYRQQISFVQEFTYNAMKQYVNAIVENYDRKSIDTLNMAYDSNSGILVGSTSMNLFTITGTDKVYQETVIPSMPIGTENIFGTIEREDAAEVQGSEE